MENEFRTQTMYHISKFQKNLAALVQMKIILKKDVCCNPATLAHNFV
jgi:hypothetical protein